MTYQKEKQKEGLKRQPSQNETSESSGDEKRQTRREDAMNIIAQARVKKRVVRGKKKTTKTTKKRWAHYALPAGFAEHEYPKDLSYHTINKNMMGRKNPRYGYQTICKQYKYSGEQEQRRCKVCSYTSPAQHGPG
jgi:hypothetical protein